MSSLEIRFKNAFTSFSWMKVPLSFTPEKLRQLGSHCDEFLVHAVDVEGKASGIETELAGILAEYGEKPVTYAGGVGSMEDIRMLNIYGKGLLDVTVGSALDLFGGKIPFVELKKMNR